MDSQHIFKFDIFGNQIVKDSVHKGESESRLQALNFGS